MKLIDTGGVVSSLGSQKSMTNNKKMKRASIFLDRMELSKKNKRKSVCLGPSELGSEGGRTKMGKGSIRRTGNKKKIIA